MTVDRLGLAVSVTTIERTFADLFDRYDLAGGSEELFNSLDLVARVDAATLVRHVRALGNAAAAGALGYWLEREQKRLGVPVAALEEIRTLAPSQARYALGTKSGEGRTAKGWNGNPSHRGHRTQVRGSVNGRALCPNATANRRRDRSSDRDA